MTGFAVFDVETTGLYNSDRIVEVGVVLLDENLRVEHEWGTLLNPHRHLSASHIHGITATDVAGAPDFAHVAAHLEALLDRRVVVAHNATFDLRMLAHALDHAGEPAPPELLVVDTLRLARSSLGGPASLAVVAEYLSIDAPDAHDALADARVTAEVLTRLLEQSDGVITTGAALRQFNTTTVAASEFLDDYLVELLLGQASTIAWDGASWLDPAPTHTRSNAARARADRDGYLARLVVDLPAIPALDSPDLDTYLVMLEEALADRLLTSAECEALAALAQSIPLAAQQVTAAHLAFLSGLAVAAWADGVVTRAERLDLGRVATLLGLDASDVEAALAAAAKQEQAVSAPASGMGLAPGDRVVFTGEASMPRAMLTMEAEAAGLVVTGSVSKKTRIVVMADPLSESGKARKARELGIQVVAEQVFLTACTQLRESLDRT